ncbi:hypothetical protein LA23_11150, partial [Xanthomonas oryzae pv. oryzae]
QNRADLLEPLTAHVTWIVLLAHSWSLHGLNKIVNRFLAQRMDGQPSRPLIVQKLREPVF